METDRQKERDVAREGGREEMKERDMAERGRWRWRWRDGSQHIHRYIKTDADTQKHIQTHK